MSHKPDAQKDKDFQQAANDESPSLWMDFWAFLKESKKWWLVPILIALALVGLLVMLGGTGVAPFIYTLF